MFKKMMLMAVSVAALVAFAVPASASASPDLFWETRNTPLGSETPGDEVVFHGTLSSTKGALKISCDATAVVDLWNDPTLGAHGKVTSLTLSADPTPTPRCTVAVLTEVGYVDVEGCEVNASVSNLPWTVTTSSTGSAHHATIDDATFTNEFIGCGALGLPEGFKASDTGDATGEVIDNCIRYTNAGTFEGGSTIDGELCATGDLRLTTEEAEE